MSNRLNLILLILGVLFLSSCEKENLDTSVSMEEELVVEVVSCNLEVSVMQNAAGVLVSTITGGTAPFTYAWSTGETTSEIDNLNNDIFDLTVVDAEGCTASASGSCGGLGVVIGLTQTHVTTVESGGLQPYSYEWSNGETVGYIPLDGSDVYEVTVTDADDCTATATIDITVPCAGFVLLPFYTEQGIYPSSAGVESISQSPPLSYLWSTGETTLLIDNLVSGNTYDVTVTDSEGCTLVESITMP